MMYRVINITPRNRAAAIALAVAAIFVGGVVLAMGLTLLLGVATVAVVGGLGVTLYRRLMGTVRGVPPVRRAPDLDPSMEVFPARAHSRPLPPRVSD
ncbi:MAG TPA: hypothetical protein VIQ74_14235 [Gemmatimonadaceae bacterium]|jgi:hypothetical protein